MGVELVTKARKPEVEALLLRLLNEYQRDVDASLRVGRRLDSATRAQRAVTRRRFRGRNADARSTRIIIAAVSVRKQPERYNDKAFDSKESAC